MVYSYILALSRTYQDFRYSAKLTFHGTCHVCDAVPLQTETGSCGGRSSRKCTGRQYSNFQSSNVHNVVESDTMMSGSQIGFLPLHIYTSAMQSSSMS
jgi:hypothetical protein